MNKSVRRWEPPLNWLNFLIIVLLVLGVFFRFANLDRKIYWLDETFTSLRVSGYTAVEVEQQASFERVIGVEDLQKYQRTNSEKGVIDTVKGLAIEEPQHPPLYFVMTRLWVQWFGNSVAVTRSLPALISLLVFPCLYWLCLELFESSLTGWIAIALIAVSPFHVLYAQEAREYSLWTVTILLSSASLLRAMRLKTSFSWGIYAVTVTVGLYSFLLSGLVTIGHGIYVVIIERFRLCKAITGYMLASLAGLLAFMPWLFFVMNNLSQVRETTAFTSKETPFSSLASTWVGNISRVFFDLNLDSSDALILTIIPGLIFLTLVIYSICFLYYRTPKGVWLFVLILIGTTALPLSLPDLLLGGQRSGVGRYLIPCYLGIQISVAYLLATQITARKVGRQKIWQLLMLALISSGVVSCALSSQAETWWNKKLNSKNLQVAFIINQTTNPLLISDDQLTHYALTLSYLLDPKVKLQLEPQCRLCPDASSTIKPNIPKIPDGFSDVFLLRPSNALLSELEKKYKIKPVLERSKLWKLEK